MQNIGPSLLAVVICLGKHSSTVFGLLATILRRSLIKIMEPLTTRTQNEEQFAPFMHCDYMNGNCISGCRLEAHMTYSMQNIGPSMLTVVPSLIATFRRFPPSSRKP